MAEYDPAAVTPWHDIYQKISEPSSDHNHPKFGVLTDPLTINTDQAHWDELNYWLDRFYGTSLVPLINRWLLTALTQLNYQARIELPLDARSEVVIHDCESAGHGTTQIRLWFPISMAEYNQLNSNLLFDDGDHFNIVMERLLNQILHGQTLNYQLTDRQKLIWQAAKSGGAVITVKELIHLRHQ